MGLAWAQNPLKGALWLPVLWALLSTVCCSHVPPVWRFTSSEVVIPRKVPHRRGGSETPDQLSYSIRFRGQRHVVHMKLKKNLMPRNFPLITNNDQGAIQEDYPFVPQDCHYYSHLEGVPGSMATLDTCYGGLRGMLQVDDLTYEIKPLQSSSKFEHVISLLVSEGRGEADKCTIEAEETDEAPEEVKLPESPRSGSIYLWRLHMKQLKLHYTITNSMYKLDSNRSHIVDNIVVITNVLDSIYSHIGLHVYIRILCIWEDKDQFDFFKYGSAEQATHEFGLWKYYGMWKEIQCDTSVVYTAYQVGTVWYFASWNGICNPNWGAMYVHLVRYHLFLGACVTAHAIGHNMAVGHDGKNCICFRRQNCVMASVPGLHDMFSNCSYNVIHDRLNSWDPCFSEINIPYNNFPYNSNRCGDKNVTLHEECDCGSFKECANDTCCGTNCALTSGSVCDKGGCCDRCRIMRPGSVCRDTLGICDLPEYCDGKSPLCPADFYIQDGTPCSPLSVCVRGNCSDRDMQCQALFGYQVKDGSPICYKELNKKGDRFGNCGIKIVRGGSQPMRCEADDVFCGMLHCSNVEQLPGGGEHRTFHQILAGDVKLELCFGYDAHHGAMVPEMGLVVDGATCGPGQYCYNRNCTFHQDMAFNCDVKTCHYRGVCNNQKHCHCVKGWKPPNCEERGWGGSVDSGPPPDLQIRLRANVHVSLNKVLALMLGRFAAFCLVLLIGTFSKAKQVVEKQRRKD